MISGQQLRRTQRSLDSLKELEVKDLYCEVFVKGTLKDERSNSRFRTRRAEGDGLHPEWRQKCIFTLKNPQVAFLVFLVWEAYLPGKKRKVGQYAISCSCIRAGYRAVPVWDEKLRTVEHCCLFCEIQKKFILKEEAYKS